MFSLKKSKLNNFNATANSIVENYYLTPYPVKASRRFQPSPIKANLKDGKLERPAHGAMHASRVAIHVESFYQLNKKHDNSFASKWQQLAKSLDVDVETLLLLTKYGALFHDSARQDDGVDYWDKFSAINCKRYLQKHGVPEYLADFIKISAEHKGDYQNFVKELNNLNAKYNKNIDAKNATLAREFIGDSDCLDIIRVRRKYDIKYLNFYRKFKNDPEAKQELIDTCKNVGNIIYLQSDAYFQTDIEENGNFIAKATPARSFNEANKITYEQAQKPFDAVLSDFNNKPKNTPINVPSSAPTSATPVQTQGNKTALPTNSTNQGANKKSYLLFGTVFCGALFALGGLAVGINFLALAGFSIKANLAINAVVNFTIGASVGFVLHKISPYFISSSSGKKQQDPILDKENLTELLAKKLLSKPNNGLYNSYSNFPKAYVTKGESHKVVPVIKPKHPRFGA